MAKPCRVGNCKAPTADVLPDHSHKCALCSGLVRCEGEDARVCQVEGLRVVCEECEK